MTQMTANSGNCEREFEFALIVGGVPELNDAIMDALSDAGCNDATVSMQYGLLYLEFGRTANSLQDAIISAIRNVLDAGIGASVVRVDDCNLVTQAEIARRMGRSRQMVFQYITGARGPGGFPPPACLLTEERPLWQWCAVSYWLYTNNLLREEECLHAAVVEAINNLLERQHMPPGLFDRVSGQMDFLGI